MTLVFDCSRVCGVHSLWFGGFGAYPILYIAMLPNARKMRALVLGPFPKIS